MACAMAQRYGRGGTGGRVNPFPLPMHLVNECLCQGTGTGNAGRNRPGGRNGGLREVCDGHRGWQSECKVFRLHWNGGLFRSWLAQSLKEQFLILISCPWRKPYRQVDEGEWQTKGFCGKPAMSFAIADKENVTDKSPRSLYMPSLPSDLHLTPYRTAIPM